MAKEKYIVEIDRPKDVTVEGMKNYITEAVQSWKGGFMAEDPITDLDRNTIKVKRFHE